MVKVSTEMSLIIWVGGAVEHFLCVLSIAHLSLLLPTERVQRGQSQSLPSGAQCQKKRCWAQTEMQEVLTGHHEAVLYSEDDRALEQDAQRSCSLHPWRYSKAT